MTRPSQALVERQTAMSMAQARVSRYCHMPNDLSRRNHERFSELRYRHGVPANMVHIFAVVVANRRHGGGRLILRMIP